MILDRCTVEYIVFGSVCHAIEALAESSTGLLSAMLLKVVFELSDEGGATALVPAPPSCISEGDTLDEARRNVREAIELYLEPADEPQAPDGGFLEEIAV